MDEPAAQNKPVSRSYQVIRDIGAVVDHIRAKHRVQKVTLIGWSWGAMTGGYYASLHSEKVNKLVMYAPAYAFPLHTNLGPGSGLQNKRKPTEFNYALGAYRLASTAANTARWDGEIPVTDKTQYRDPAVPDAFWKECLASDPTSGTRTPPSLRAPNGVLEDTFMQATGRRIWNASSIYVPVLVIAGEYDTWSYPEDREGLLRDLTNAPAKRHVTMKDSTHFTLFEKPRFEFFEEIRKFLRE
jgi:pimeloyl-ACP methyl ester carboxylesterase